MGHGRDKPAREKRKPKKDKAAVAKSSRESEVLVHVQQHPRDTETREA